MMKRASEFIYNSILEEDEVRACENIPENACSNIPQNFTKNSASGVLSKFAEQLASPGVVLPYIFSVLGVPAFFSGFLIPVKNAGSLLPQLFVSAKIRSFKIRKYFWGISSMMQGFFLIALAFVLNSFDPYWVGWITLGVLLFFSVASGVASVAFKDVMGKTIPKGNRGRLLSTRATGGGIFTLVAGITLFFVIQGAEKVIVYQMLVGTAGITWIVSALLFLWIKEHPGATEGGRSPLVEVKKGLKLFNSDSNFRLFLIVRVLLMVIPLSLPFLILLANQQLQTGIKQLGAFMIISGIANTVNSPYWGRFSDTDSKKLMRVIALIGIGILLLALLYPLLPEQLKNVYTFVPILFLVSMAHGGARLGRKTYLVDYAPEKERPLYIAFANTFIGIFTIVSGLLGLIASYFSLKILFIVMIGLLLLAIFLSMKLKKV